MTTVPMFIGDEWTNDGPPTPLVNPYTGEPFAEVATASPEQVDRAVRSLSDRYATDGPIHPYERYEILARASALVDDRRDVLVDSIVSESGFTVSDAEGEVNRAIQTLLLSGEEAKRLAGEVVPFDGAPGITGRLGFTMRVPIGLVCAITPFNSPLNTVCHKLGPALAAGNPLVLKPALATPRTATLLTELLLDAGLPPRLIALVHGGGRSVGQQLLEHPAFRFYTFTGSTEVGRIITRTIGLRRSQLELGSISSTIVCDDARLDLAVQRTVPASFRKAGQVCTSVQRLYVHEDVRETFTEAFLDHLARQQVGDPTDRDTLVGPMIEEAEAERVEGWVERAVDGGAKVLAGGPREGALHQPTVLVGVDDQMPVVCREVFGPIVSIIGYRDLDATFDRINDTPYGLAAGIFTENVHRGFRAAQRLHFGSVHINQTSSSRVDLMPYGGVKDSGSGQEGPHYAMRELTEERLVTLTLED
jgi:acyl-CoA reductase-like NAD-dependent aldehyde dehydrogenase